MLNILEPVNVWVFFKKNLIQPHSFFWQGRQIKVDKINLVHTSKDGASLFSEGKQSHGLFYHFSISAGGNFYRLRFDVSKLDWSLEAVDEE